MFKYLLVGMILFPSLSYSKESETASYFVQMYTVTSESPTYIDEAYAPGRIEVSADNKFVACAQAFTIKDWDGRVLAPISSGFVFKGDKSKLKFEMYDELKRLTKLEVKISKMEE